MRMSRDQWVSVGRPLSVFHSPPVCDTVTFVDMNLNLWLIQCASLLENHRVRSSARTTRESWIAASHRSGLESGATGRKLQRLGPDANSDCETSIDFSRLDTIDLDPEVSETKVSPVDALSSDLFRIVNDKACFAVGICHG